jgi:hypothetical protein
MEILRFEEASTSAPKRKKSSKGYLAVGLVATLFGVSSAFATNSITINNDQNISLGQGISTFTTCDSYIAVIPNTELNGDLETFGLTSVTIGALYDDKLSGTDPKHVPDTEFRIDNLSGKCLNADFAVKFYDGANSPVDVCDTDIADFVNVKITGTETNSTSDCYNKTIFFRVTATSHVINFGGDFGTDFFDHISLETTTYTY